MPNLHRFISSRFQIFGNTAGRFPTTHKCTSFLLDCGCSRRFHQKDYISVAEIYKKANKKDFIFSKKKDLFTFPTIFSAKCKGRGGLL